MERALDIFRERDRLNVKGALHPGRCAMKNRIEELRNHRGIRQEELAKEMGVSRQTISSLENGRYNPSILLAHKIAVFFDLSIEDVFLFEEE
jgi:putative transcriptional regulator